MIVRSQVINNALAYTEIDEWNPTTDIMKPGGGDLSKFKGKFELGNFTSCFRNADEKDKPIFYDVMPYVWGRRDDLKEFKKRINAGCCPGGWDQVSGRAVYEWAKPLLWEYGTQYLAGIDCAGYVSNCWDLKRYHYTQHFPDICVNIDKHSLKAGDIFNKEYDHVCIFAHWGNGANKVLVYEAVGGGKPGEFFSGQSVGRVICEELPYTVRSDSTFTFPDGIHKGVYTPYSIFPQFFVIEPRRRIVDPRTRFRIRVTGSGKLEFGVCSLDGRTIRPKEERNSAKLSMDLIYIPDHDLKPGPHSLLIKATNEKAEQSFQDELFWRFEVNLNKAQKIV